MASFVREVLSATGTLGEIGNFPGKIGKIQKKLQDLKSGLLVHIDSKYSKFSSNLNDASSLTTQMEDLSLEIETLNNSINNHLKTQLGDCNKELLQLTNEIQELSLTLQVVNKIKTCYDAIEEGNEMVSEGKWLAASKTLAQGLDFVKRNNCGLDEENIKIMPVIKLEMIRQQQRILETVCKQWRERVVMSKEENQNVFWIKYSGDKQIIAKEMLQAMYFSELLEEQLVRLAINLKQNFLEPIMTKTCCLNIDEDNRKLTLTPTSAKSAPSPSLVFRQIRELFSFISIYLDVSLDPDQDHVTLLSSLSPHLCSWLTDSVVRLVLAPSVPDSPAQLSAYQETVDQTEQLQEYLVNTRLVPSDNLTLLNYARNVDAIFASKLCQNLLAESREIMKRDLFISTKVSPKEIENVEESIDDNDDVLAIPPNFPLPENTFQFPSCQISSSVLDLLALARKGLDDASEAKSLCQIRLYHTVRGVFSLWAAVTPTYHASILSSLPQTAALAHNSAFYLAHSLVTLGFEYRDKLPAVTAGTGGCPTFVDLVPKLREVGADLLLANMRLHRDTLKQILNTAGFPALATDRRLSSGAEQGVKQVISTLSHLHKVWSGVLPSNVYLKCIGTLLNTVMEELIQIVTTLEDISADAGEQLVSMLNQLSNKSTTLFESEEPKRYVKKWTKFKELIFILGASLREIEDGWGGGQGRLCAEFPAEQVKQLIRALFQNTERRAAVLAKIK